MSDTKNSLESWVVGQLQNGIDPLARRTRGSGCGNEISDVSNKYLYIECKMRHGNENIIMKFKEDWQHLLFRLPMKTNKIPIFVTENKYGNKFVTLKAEDFFTLLKEAKNG